jgi:hypothetical protein
MMYCITSLHQGEDQCRCVLDRTTSMLSYKTEQASRQKPSYSLSISTSLRPCTRRRGHHVGVSPAEPYILPSKPPHRTYARRWGHRRAAFSQVHARTAKAMKPLVHCALSVVDSTVVRSRQAWTNAGLGRRTHCIKYNWIPLLIPWFCICHSNYPSSKNSSQ